MPTKKKLDYPELSRKQVWQISWYTIKEGKRVRIRKSEWDGVELNSITDLKERETAAQEMLQKIRADVCPPAVSPEHEEFLKALNLALAIKRSPKWRTNKGYSENVRWLSNYFHKKGWQYLKCKDVTFEHIQAYFDYMVLEKKIANTTHNSRKNNLRALATALVDRNYIKENFFSKLEQKPEGDPIRRPLTEDEKALVMEEAMKDSCLKLMFILLGYLGIRPGEMRDLKVNHIDLQKGFIKFPGRQSKNNKNSTVTIPEDLIPVLEEYGFHRYPKNFFVFGGGRGRHNKQLRPGPYQIGVSTLSQKFRTMLKRLVKEGKLHSIEGLCFYSLKDTLALFLLEHMDVVSAMWHFRQNSLEVFKRYVKRLGQENPKVRKMPIDFPKNNSKASPLPSLSK